MPKPFFANMDPARDIEERVNDTMERAWYWDGILLYIVTGTDVILGPKTEMRDAMQTLLDSEEYFFHRLDEYLRIEWVPKHNRHFSLEHGFYAA